MTDKNTNNEKIDIGCLYLIATVVVSAIFGTFVEIRDHKNAQYFKKTEKRNDTNTEKKDTVNFISFPNNQAQKLFWQQKIIRSK